MCYHLASISFKVVQYKFFSIHNNIYICRGFFSIHNNTYIFVGTKHASVTITTTVTQQAVTNKLTSTRNSDYFTSYVTQSERSCFTFSKPSISFTCKGWIDKNINYSLPTFFIIQF